MAGDQHAAPAVSPQKNAAFKRMMRRLPAHIRASLTPLQLEAIADAVVETNARHSLAVRKSWRVFGRRYYLAFFIGRENRRRPTAVETFVSQGLELSWRQRAVNAVFGGGIALLAMAAGVGLVTLFVTLLGHETVMQPMGLVGIKLD